MNELNLPVLRSAFDIVQCTTHYDDEMTWDHLITERERAHLLPLSDQLPSLKGVVIPRMIMNNYNKSATVMNVGLLMKIVSGTWLTIVLPKVPVNVIDIPIELAEPRSSMLFDHVFNQNVLVLNSRVNRILVRSYSLLRPICTYDDLRLILDMINVLCASGYNNHVKYVMNAWYHICKILDVTAKHTNVTNFGNSFHAFTEYLIIEVCNIRDVILAGDSYSILAHQYNETLLSTYIEITQNYILACVNNESDDTLKNIGNDMARCEELVLADLLGQSTEESDVIRCFKISDTIKRILYDAFK